MVSVVIPNYNHYNYLEQRIQSVLNQSYQEFEVIILDDKSSDDSKKIIEKFRGEKKINLIVYNDVNSGSTFKQWRKGIDLAKGDWIWIAESDDYCEPNLLQTLVDGIESCENVVLSYSQSYEVDENGMVIRDMNFHTDALSSTHWKNSFCAVGTEEIQKYLLYRNTIPNASAVLFKKVAYEIADKSFENMRYCGDWKLWIEILKHGNVSYSAKPLNYFRKHNLTTRVLNTPEKGRKRLQEEFEVLNGIKSDIQINMKEYKRCIHKIVSTYSTYFTKKDILLYLLGLKKYKSIISFKLLLKAYFSKRLKLNN